MRYVDETEATWVRQIFQWAAEGETLNGITYKLRELGVSTPSGKGHWIRSTVAKILCNEGYLGSVRFGDVELTTERIVTPALFNHVRTRMKANKRHASRNGKVNYLLRGHITCSRCGRKYWGYSRWHNGQPDKSNQRYYYCMGRRRIVTPHKCDNRGFQADYLESVVWERVEEVLSKPEVILDELERRQNEPSPTMALQEELQNMDKRLSDLDNEQEQLLQWALKGFPGATVEAENQRINKYRLDLQQRRTELQVRAEDVREGEVTLERVAEYCELARANLPNFTFEDKRLALSELDIDVCIDGDNVSITGAIPCDTVSTPPCWRKSSKATGIWRSGTVSGVIFSLTGRRLPGTIPTTWPTLRPKENVWERTTLSS
jgi:hypothetical protein